MQEETRRLILDKAIAVWLDADIDVLAERVRRREVRLNVEYLYDHKSPIGYTAVPQAVGGTGSVVNANLEMSF